MAFGIGKPRVSPIAIDFGADSVKLLQIAHDDPPQLIGAACAEVPEDLRNNESAKVAFLGETVRSLLKEAPFRGRRVVCSIPAYQTLTQNFSVANSDTIPLDERVSTQLRDRFHVEPTRMVLRCQDVGEVNRHGRQMTEAVCLAAERSVVNRYLEVMHQSKLEVCGVQTESVAMMNTYRYLVGDDQEDSVVLLVDLGAACTKFIVVQGMQLRIARMLPVGWDQLVRAVSSTHQISFADARAKVASAATVPLQPDLASTVFGGDQQAGAVATVTADAGRELSDLIEDELKLCLRYFDQVCPEKEIEGIIFVGGGARDQNQCKAWAKAIGLPAMVGDPTARLMSLSRNKPYGVSFNEPQPGWAVPMGLCLAETDN